MRYLFVYLSVYVHTAGTFELSGHPLDFNSHWFLSWAYSRVKSKLGLCHLTHFHRVYFENLPPLQSLQCLTVFVSPSFVVVYLVFLCRCLIVAYRSPQITEICLCCQISLIFILVTTYHSTWLTWTISMIWVISGAGDNDWSAVTNVSNCWICGWFDVICVIPPSAIVPFVVIECKVFLWSMVGLWFIDGDLRSLGSRAGFRGGRAPGLPPTGGLPPNPSIFKTL